MAAALPLVLLLTAGSAATADPELQLHQHLLNISSQLTHNVYPRLNQRDGVSVRFKIYPRLLVEVNSAEQTVRLSAFLQASWDDERLVWSPQAFGNISNVTWSRQRLWQPIIAVFNGIDSSQMLQPQLDAALTSLSPSLTSVTTNWKQELKFFCDMSMTRFPMDEHECSLQLVAADAGGMKPGVAAAGVSAHGLSGNELRGMYTPSREWQLQQMRTSSRMLALDMGDGAPSELNIFEFRFRIRRHSAYYVAVLLLPLLLLTALQLLTYLLPLESGEKIGCGVTVLLSFTMFLLLIDNIVPKSQDVPVIVYVITASMAVAAASLIFNSVLLRMHHTSSDTRMPVWVKTLVRWIELVTCSGAAKQQKVVQVVPASCVVSDAAAAAPATVSSGHADAAAAVEKLAIVLHLLLICCLVAAFFIGTF